LASEFLTGEVCHAEAAYAAKADLSRIGLSVARLVWRYAGLSIHIRKFRPWKLLVSIEFADTNTATRFERYPKTGSGPRVREASFLGNDRP
jgi:hypothetical protein